jgi:hypothetical protein
VSLCVFDSNYFSTLRCVIYIKFYWQSCKRIACYSPLSVLIISDPIFTNFLEQSPSWEVKKFPTCYKTRRFISVSIRSRLSDPILSQTNPIQCPFLFLRLFHRIHPHPRPCIIIHFYRETLLNPLCGWTHLIYYSQLLIRYIHSCNPYLEIIFSIHNLSMRYAMVTDSLNMGYHYGSHKMVRLCFDTENVNLCVCSALIEVFISDI